MKTNLTILATLISVLVMAQDNKPVAGDFGVKYSVNFSGVTSQSLTFSGMITNRWEIGSSITVSYSQSTSDNIYAQGLYVYPTGQNSEYIAAQQTITGLSKSLNLSLNPFILYHFPIKNNIDLYAGANISVGTGSVSLANNSTSTTVATNYYSQQYSSTTYPFGYAFGGGIMLGAQYFFYKNLALGVAANLGVTYSGREGIETVSYSQINSGSFNDNTNNASGTYSSTINQHSFSLSSSNVGLSLAFYFAGKKKGKTENK